MNTREEIIEITRKNLFEVADKQGRAVRSLIDPKTENQAIDFLKAIGDLLPSKTIFEVTGFSVSLSAIEFSKKRRFEQIIFLADEKVNLTETEKAELIREAEEVFNKALDLESLKLKAEGQVKQEQQRQRTPSEKEERLKKLHEHIRNHPKYKHRLEQIKKKAGERLRSRVF